VFARVAMSARDILDRTTMADAVAGGETAIRVLEDAA
jgi:hypothetical protein